MTITRLLVANRGEIARRVFATCRRLGIETVAVHSEADAGLPFVAEADYAVPLAGSAPADTYLRVDLLLDAARRSGADAIHPGYGFLSENAEFARAVLAAGLTWVGPSPEAIEQMGSKIAAKELMAAAGVPVLDNRAPDEVAAADLPLMVKASAGGGGRGMRIVRALAELPVETARAEAEARSAFGDGTVFLEPYVEHARHIEVQVVGHSGGVLVLGERDCSIQRRHQKVVEESPAPGLSEQTRAALHDAARAAAEAIAYLGAGTVEFLVDAADPSRFWFLEMNTRLQVEHPVTELVHGVDLVELQIAVAEGRGVSTGPTGNLVGHAIEVRLYAEDPASDWQPQSGALGLFEVPGVSVEFDRPVGFGLRLDSGYVTGSEVSTHYDAMLAKLIVWAPTREQAARQLARALARARVHGVSTNRNLLVGVLRDEVFLAGRVSTSFLVDRPIDRLGGGPRSAATAAAIALAELARRGRTVQPGVPSAWRNVVSQPQVTSFLTSTGEPTDQLDVAWLSGRDGYRVGGYDVVAAGPEAVSLRADGVTTQYHVVVSGDRVDVDSTAGHLLLTRVPRFADPTAAAASGSLLAPMPGTVASVAVELGSEVVAGQPVLVLEAMKMQHTVSAPYDGTVTQLDVKAGAQVAAGEVLAVVEAVVDTGADTGADTRVPKDSTNEEQQ